MKLEVKDVRGLGRREMENPNVLKKKEIYLLWSLTKIVELNKSGFKQRTVTGLLIVVVFTLKQLLL